MQNRKAIAGWKNRIILVSLVIGLLAISLVIRQLVTKPEQVQAQQRVKELESEVAELKAKLARLKS